MTAGAGPAISALGVEFQLDGCRSLKERRSRLGGLRDRFGRDPRIALCEVASDDPSFARFTFVVIAGDQQGIATLLGRIERDLERHVDAVVVDLWREQL